MNVDWGLYETLLGNGEYSSKREVAAKEAAQSFVTGMRDDPAYQEFSVVDGAIIPIIADRTSSFACSLKAEPKADIHIGDVVECLDETWVVVDLYTDKLGVVNGTMWMCNTCVQFQNGTPYVNSRFFVVDNGTYSKNTSDPDVVASSNTYKAYMSIDVATEKLHVDKRISLGKTFNAAGEEILEVYKIIGVDNKSKNFGQGSHLMVLTLQRDVYNAHTDNIALGVCDVVDAYQESTPNDSGSCVIEGRDYVRIGTSRRLTARFIDQNGAATSTPTPLWELDAPDGVSISVDGATCNVTAELNDLLVGEEFVVRLSDISGLYGECELRGQVITVG